MNKLFLTAITKAINAYLDLDPESQSRMEKLKGRAISIELLPFHFIFQCEFTEQGVTLMNGEPREPETRIRGTPIQMASMMITQDARHRFFAEDLIIEGNAELGQQVIALLDELHIDFEEYISHFVGDVPAHHAGRLIKGIGNWLTNTRLSLTQNINEYIHEEAEWFPAKEAMKDFFNDIDTLRMDVDRLEARFHQLRHHLMDEEQK